MKTSTQADRGSGLTPEHTHSGDKGGGGGRVLYFEPTENLYSLPYFL